MTKSKRNNSSNEKSLRGKLSDGLDVPLEVLEDIPLIRLNGNKEVYVENFDGLIEYTSGKIRLNTKCGILSIDGIELFAKSMSGEQIIIRGIIEQISFVV